MFGILDRYYVGRKKGVIGEDIDWSARINDSGTSNDSWYCFVPKLVMKNGFVWRGLVPHEGRVVVYTTSYINLIVPNAVKTRDNLRVIYDDAIKKMQQDSSRGRKINVLGVSIGNVLSVRLANEVSGSRINRLVSIVGGGFLGRSAWDSIATRDVAQNSGCDSVEEYEEILAEFGPAYYLPNIFAEKVFARFGGNDLMIRYNPHGMELRNSLEKMEAHSRDIKTYKRFDHSSTILRTSWEKLHERVK
ncbi:MAG: hypothetical protein KKB31_00325 [Nanoarchaeota archaeon]|nr:hypothetical protein [Nanoarchaeota archaeon]